MTTTPPHPAPRAAGEGQPARARHAAPGQRRRAAPRRPRIGGEQAGHRVVVDLAADAALWCRQPQQPRHRHDDENPYRKWRFDDQRPAPRRVRRAKGNRHGRGPRQPRGSATSPAPKRPQIRGPGWPARPRSGGTASMLHSARPFQAREAGLGDPAGSGARSVRSSTSAARTSARNPRWGVAGPHRDLGQPGRLGPHGRQVQLVRRGADRGPAPRASLSPAAPTAAAVATPGSSSRRPSWLSWRSCGAAAQQLVVAGQGRRGPGGS